MAFALLMRRINIRWYEWVFLGSVLLLVVLYTLQNHSLKEIRQELTTVEYTLDSIASERDHLQRIRNIDELVTYDYLQDIDWLEQQQQQQRKDFINDYFSLVRDDVPSNPLPEVVNDVHDSSNTHRQVDESSSVVVGEPTVEEVVNEPPRTPQGFTRAERDRVSLIAQRLHNAYALNTAPVSSGST